MEEKPDPTARAATSDHRLSPVEEVPLQAGPGPSGDRRHSGDSKPLKHRDPLGNSVPDWRSSEGGGGGGGGGSSFSQQQQQQQQLSVPQSVLQSAAMPLVLPALSAAAAGATATNQLPMFYSQEPQPIVSQV